jgi:hypothetical protein
MLNSMSREDAHFFAVSIPVGFAGTLIATFLGWGDTGTFLATMGPLAVVMLVFILREPRDEPSLRAGTGGRPKSAADR